MLFSVTIKVPGKSEMSNENTEGDNALRSQGCCTTEGANCWECRSGGLTVSGRKLKQPA
jgi:hypothetical protein